MVQDSIIMPGAVIEPGATVKYSIIAENTVIRTGAVVGERPRTWRTLPSGASPLGEAQATIGQGAKVGPKACGGQRR